MRQQSRMSPFSQKDVALGESRACNVAKRLFPATLECHNNKKKYFAPRNIRRLDFDPKRARIAKQAEVCENIVNKQKIGTTVTISYETPV